MKKIYVKMLAVLFAVAITFNGTGTLALATAETAQTEDIYTDQVLALDSCSDTSVTFCWQSNGAGAGYAVYRKCEFDEDYVFLGAVEEDKVGRMSFTDVKFKKGIVFRYKVVHYRFNGETGEEELLGEIANIFQIKIGKAKIKSTKRTGKKVTLKWKKISGVSGYEIYRKNKNESYKKVKTITNQDTVTWTAKKVSKNSVTKFKIRAYVKYGSNKAYGIYSEQTQVYSVTEQKIKNKIKKLQKQYPDGKYWNHVGKSSFDSTTVTNKPCSHSSYDDLSTCNYYYCPDNILGYQCYGFAWLMSDLIFGKNAKITNHYSFKNAKTGDVIRHNGHSMIITEKYKNYIIVGECNYGNTCVIRWGRKVMKTELTGAKYSTRY